MVTPAYGIATWTGKSTTPCKSRWLVAKSYKPRLTSLSPNVGLRYWES